MKPNPENSETKIVIDLTPKFMEGAKAWPNKLGRYSCSKLHSMLEGAFLPWGVPANKYFELEEISFESAMRMRNGVQAHNFVQQYLDPSKVERKFEYHYYGANDPRNGTAPFKDEEGNIVSPIFIVVGKIDYLPDDSAWEIKSSEKVFKDAADYHVYQAKLYCTIADRPKAYIFQPLVEGSRFILKQVGDVIQRDDEWFAGQMLKLNAYHERLVLIQNQNAKVPNN